MWAGLGEQQSVRVRIESASCLSPCGVEGGQGISLDGELQGPVCSARLEELQQTVCIDLLVIDSTDLPALTQSWTRVPFWAVVPGWEEDEL